MTKKQQMILGSLAAALILGVAGYYAYGYWYKPSTPETKVVNVGGIEFEGVPGDANVEVVKIPKPDLDRAINIEKINPQRREKTVAEIMAVRETLKKNSVDYLNWIQLGLYYKVIEDYEGARQAWEYAASLNSQQSVAFANLGVLYGTYLKDPVKAEKYYLEAVRLEPTLGYSYIQAYEFFRNIMKNDAKAKAILEAGIKAGATDADRMQYFLDNYNKL